MTDPITLRPGCSAENETCGSCRFFERGRANDGEYEQSHGNCNIRMPPPKEFYKLKSYEELGEPSRGPMWVSDKHGCDLYRNDGKTYIVQRLIHPVVK